MWLSRRSTLPVERVLETPELAQCRWRATCSADKGPQCISDCSGQTTAGTATVTNCADTATMFFSAPNQCWLTTAHD